MTAFSLKLLAIISMVADHIGKAFFPDFYLLQGFGRVSFPLFAFLIANGAFHSASLSRYLKRLVIFALLSQYPYYLFTRLLGPDFDRLNIFFTLSLGLGVILLWKKLANWPAKIFVTLAAALISQILNFDYGASGVLLIVSFYYAFSRLRQRLWAPILILALYPLINYPQLLLDFKVVLLALSQNEMIIGLLALVPIISYSGEEGPKLKYLFYWFYPIHLIIIYLLALFPSILSL